MEEMFDSTSAYQITKVPNYITKIKFSWNLRNGKVALLLIGEWRDKLEQLMDEYLCIHRIE